MTWEEALDWLESAANGVTMDLAVEEIDLGELDDLGGFAGMADGYLSGDDASTATLLARVEDEAFAEHVLLRAKVEVLELVREMEMA